MGCKKDEELENIVDKWSCVESPTSFPYQMCCQDSVCIIQWHIVYICTHK